MCFGEEAQAEVKGACVPHALVVVEGAYDADRGSLRLARAAPVLPWLQGKQGHLEALTLEVTVPAEVSRGRLEELRELLERFPGPGRARLRVQGPGWSTVALLPGPVEVGLPVCAALSATGHQVTLAKC